MSAKKWLKFWGIIYVFFLFAIMGLVVYIDPFFHFHGPVDKFVYPFYEQRYINDGITKHFEYDAMITGTSMTENFKTSEFDELFDVNSIKIPYSGSTFKEINDNLKVALETHPEMKYVVRCLDYEKLLDSADKMRTDLGEYPEYLYDDNIFNDVKYVFNKSVLFDYCGISLRSYLKGEEGRITSFDEYANWSHTYPDYGAKLVLGDRTEYQKAEVEDVLTEAERENLIKNIKQNVVDLAQKNPQTQFLYYFSPYSVAYWGERYESGEISKQLEAEKIAIELILKCENIQLFSFNHLKEITTNLDNYRDALHYGEWINSFVLQSMAKREYLLTKENYMEYLKIEKELYESYDYSELF